jgi:hypothetical protein
MCRDDQGSEIARPKAQLPRDSSGQWKFRRIGAYIVVAADRHG